MANTVEDLRLYQWGREATKGTLIAATSKMVVESFEITEVDDLLRPDLALGVMTRTPANETPQLRGVLWKAKGPLNYEQLQNWLSMGMEHIADPGAGPPATWAFVRVPTAVPTLDAFTIQRRLTDGSTPTDSRFGYAMMTDITITAARNGVLSFEANGFGRRIQAGTLTAAQTAPAVEIPPHALTKGYADSTWGTLGTTQIVGQVVDWKWKFMTGIKPFVTADGRSDLDYQQHVVDGKAVGTELDLTLLGTTQYAIEKTAAEAGTLRAIRLSAAGSSSRSLQIDGLYKHVKGSILAVGELDGQDIFACKLQESTDYTNLAAVTLINGVTALV